MSFDVRRCQSNSKDVRSLGVEDKRKLAGLDALCFPNDETYPIRGRWWWMVEDFYWNPVAYAGLAPCPETPGFMFLCRSGTLPSHRRKGFAQRLTVARLEFARTRCEGVLTYVERSNIASGNNLLKAGMKLCVPTYRYGGDDAIYFSTSW
jgi:GNAT superfamily N-acetyltransferase